MSTTHVRTDSIEVFKAMQKMLEKRGYVMQDDKHNIDKKEYSTTFKK